MKENLILQKITVNNYEINELFNYLNQDFKSFERLPLFIIRSALKKGILNAVYLTDGQQVYGYAIYQTVPTYKWLHVLYLAILPEHRSLGLGSTIIKLLNELTDKGIILEVEAPEAGKNEEDSTTRKRRVQFYERNGFNLNPDMNLKNFGYHIKMMSNINLLPEINWLEFYRVLYNRVYGLPLGSLFIKNIR
ncbi:GNAT family N-acetyltransferase [Metabacillus niabensis]|uniref:GNAT superfamily N-acetyltransferase n=1 Tax=Metabacillus niabensis TaxID=324854 RepID=A0ABT9YWL6_9BACI|nr:GNAT family N-acetyltransferase [Metabacillus niabensis]MDQ0224383.1 GNAT superfamily N-acetyltransferase [Metabacillus niabensis]